MMVVMFSSFIDPQLGFAPKLNTVASEVVSYKTRRSEFVDHEAVAC